MDKKTYQMVTKEMSVFLFRTVKVYNFRGIFQKITVSFYFQPKFPEFFLLNDKHINTFAADQI